MTKFEINKTYACRSICDHECVWAFTIASRTAKTIKTTDGKTLRINPVLSEMNQAESVFPMGRYSMAPILTAAKLVAPPAGKTF